MPGDLDHVPLAVVDTDRREGQLLLLRPDYVQVISAAGGGWGREEVMGKLE